jgi:hypothetical protein
MCFVAALMVAASMALLPKPTHILDKNVCRYLVANKILCSHGSLCFCNILGDIGLQAIAGDQKHGMYSIRLSARSMVEKTV